jgi:glyoxylase-like metal-dependent hydrolase (beta-lactamase superfamily II)
MATDLRKLKKFRLPAGALIVVVSAFITYMLRGGFRRFESAPYNPPPAAFTNWNDVLTHPRDISVVTFQTGVVHMDACLNLDPTSPKQAECDHVPRDLTVLVHWIHHARFGDFLIDTGFDDSFAKHPPFGNYTEAMKLFNWVNGVTNRQRQGEDLSAQLARLNVHPRAVFFTHFHPDHTGGVPALGPQTDFIFGKLEASFLARAAVANHFLGKSKFSSLDFSAAPRMAPLGASIDLFGDGSLVGDFGSRPYRRRHRISDQWSPAPSVDRRREPFRLGFQGGGRATWMESGGNRSRLSKLSVTACLRESLPEHKSRLRTRSGTFLTCTTAS